VHACVISEDSVVSRLQAGYSKNVCKLWQERDLCIVLSVETGHGRNPVYYLRKAGASVPGAKALGVCS
jgi:hypothetical protein